MHAVLLQTYPTGVDHHMRRVAEVPRRQADRWRRLRGTGSRAQRKLRRPGQLQHPHAECREQVDACEKETPPPVRHLQGSVTFVPRGVRLAK